ncbi:MAG TPA: transcription antitermination factor NusB [Clostridiaceae bacterium]|nr:transcription antitermination factor NusB [Clostridiaceae bacterium]
MSRHSAREKSVMLLYQLDVREGSIEKIKEIFLSQYPIENESDRKYFDFLVGGVIENRETLDDIIAKYLRGWTLDRQSLLDLAILRVAILELLFDTRVPVEIAISEAVILANRYGDDNSRPFINAVLGNIEKNEHLRIEVCDDALQELGDRSARPDDDEDL